MRGHYQAEEQRYKQLMMENLAPTSESCLLRREQTAQGRGELEASMAVNDEWMKTVEPGSRLTMGKTNAYDAYYLADAYKQGIREGRYTTKELDDKVRRVLRLFYRTTMRRNKPVGFLCSDAHYEAALKIAQEGIVLLKNVTVPDGSPSGKRNLLPINPTEARSILVVGENAIKMMTVGGGSSSLKAQREILPLDGIKARFKSATVDYARGYVGDTVQSYNGVTVGRSLYETRSQAELTAEAVDKARRADVVVFIGGPWLAKVPAVVQAWFIGSEAGEAIASVLAGDVNPSGKLSFTWYASINQCGAHATGSYPGTWRPDHRVIDEEYREDIFVGYRWTDRLKAKDKPLFPFGHGAFEALVGTSAADIAARCKFTFK